MADLSTINISKQFCPRRGKKTTMINTKADLVLAAGELFVEYPDTGVGTGAHRIKIGDGVTAYGDLPYALGGSASETTVDFTESTATTAADALAAVTTGANLADITANLKKAIELTASEARTYELSGVADATNGNAGIVLTPSEGEAKTVAIKGAGDVEVTSDAAGDITVSYTHPDSGVVAGTYTKVTVDAQGHVTAAQAGIDAADIVSGTIDIARLPHGAIERLVVVADETAMLNLTVEDIQTGDTVKNAETNEMYFVVDDTKLATKAEDGTVTAGTMDAFVVYTAGAATSIDWAGVENKPEEIVNLATKQSEQDAAIKTNADAIAVNTTSISANADAIKTNADAIAVNTTSIAANATAIAELEATAVEMTGATNTADGAAGYVPAPSAGQESMFLMGNGTWGTIAEATQDASGVMSATDKAIVDTVAAGTWDFGDEG